MAWAQISALILLLGGSSFINLSSAPSCLHRTGDDHSHSHSHIHAHAHDQNSHDNGHIHDHEHKLNLELAHGSHHSHNDHDSDGHHHDVDHPHHHHHHHHDHRHESKHHSAKTGHFKLAEELAEEEELRLYGFDPQSHSEESHHHHHHHHDHKISEKSSVLGLWLPALGCSLLVSMASLICLILLPFIVAQGRPSRIVVDFLAAFGAGAMLGDAFLHQLPHALGGSHAHNVEHNHHEHDHSHHDDGAQGHGHAHSIQDLSVGLAVLAGIILFFIVEKIVRQVEKSSSKGGLTWGHHHHHHHHEDNHNDEHRGDGESQGQKNAPDKETLKEKANDSTQETTNAHEPRRRKNARKDSIKETTPLLSDKDDSEKKSAVKPVEKIDPPNHILGYLNLFSDGVHNFTDGMALGSAFLNHGTIGGWSRTLFLLAHEIPQEVGDFGVLLQSGFTVFKALAFNFLSALVALAGTALALLWGGSPENSSLIEGFTAGGFIYIAIAGVLPEMHRTGTSAKTTFLQLVALGSGMSIALLISLIE